VAEDGYSIVNSWRWRPRRSRFRACGFCWTLSAKCQMLVVAKANAPKVSTMVSMPIGVCDLEAVPSS